MPIGGIPIEKGIHRRWRNGIQELDVDDSECVEHAKKADEPQPRMTVFELRDRRLIQLRS
jgi:hypothetical protein